jgi:hypothetical protein
MIPVYFPFTFLPVKTGLALRAWFEQVAVYLPSGRNLPPGMADLASEGGIDLRRPFKNHDEKIAAACRTYREWGALHEENTLTVFKSRSGSVPFFDASTTQKIRSDIENYPHGAAEEDSPEFTARVFLQLAQEFDQDQDELTRALYAVDSRKQDLFDALMGEGTREAAGAGAPDTPLHPSSRDHMIEERLKAWLFFMWHDTLFSGLFVTDHQAVWELLLEHASGAETIFDLPSLPIAANQTLDWPEKLVAFLETLVGKTWPLSNTDPPELPKAAQGEPQMLFKLAVIPGVTPDRFFAGTLRPSFPTTQRPKLSEKVENTLIGLMMPR